MSGSGHVDDAPENDASRLTGFDLIHGEAHFAGPLLDVLPTCRGTAPGRGPARSAKFALSAEIPVPFLGSGLTRTPERRRCA